MNTMRKQHKKCVKKHCKSLIASTLRLSVKKVKKSRCRIGIVYRTYADAEHIAAQQLGKAQWYTHFSVEVCEVQRRYSSPSSKQST